MKSFLPKWLLRMFTVPVAIVIWSASPCSCSWSFWRSLLVVSVIVPKAQFIMGITSPFVHWTCCILSSSRSCWYFSDCSIRLCARCFLLFSLVRLFLRFLLRLLRPSLYQHYDFSYKIFALEWLFINSFTTFLTT